MSARRRKPEPVWVKRPMAKAIAIGNIINQLLYDLHERQCVQQGKEPTLEGVKAWEPLRAPWAEIILPHFEAYDQRVA
jgi:hypothetical protein